MNGRSINPKKLVEFFFRKIMILIDIELDESFLQILLELCVVLSPKCFFAGLIGGAHPFSHDNLVGINPVWTLELVDHW
jgi:hypothetical protein